MVMGFPHSFLDLIGRNAANVVLFVTGFSGVIILTVHPKHVKHNFSEDLIGSAENKSRDALN